MKALLIVTAAMEMGVGLGLLGLPAVVVSLLLGAPLDLRTGVVIARITGAALLALGLACWLARGEVRSRAASGVVAAMLVYNTGAVAVFAYAGLCMRLSGIGLWPAAALHAAMAIWCIASLRGTRSAR